MTVLADKIDGVIDVDPHRGTLAAAVVNPIGGVLAQTTVPASAAGYECLVAFATPISPAGDAGRWRARAATGLGVSRSCSPGGAGAGSGLAQASRRRSAAKTDALDAIRAAREALTRDHVAAPRQRGDREALRVLLTTRHSATVARVAAVNQLKALSVGAPEELRDQLRGRSTAAQVTYCAGLQAQPFTSLEHRMTVRVLRSTARRVRLLAAEAAELEGEVAKLVAAVAPWLVELWCWAAERRPGAGELVARRPGALRSRLRCPVGVSPIPASSGQVTRHRLNRGGDRQLNRALHTVAVVRLRDDPQTRSYAARRRSEGRHSREIRRCVKRAVAR